jgi:polar amino acid transport system permease protein
VILPQALVAMLPPWGNLFIELLKNTALVSLITISELTFMGQLVRNETLRTAEVSFPRAAAVLPSWRS